MSTRGVRPGIPSRDPPRPLFPARGLGRRAGCGALVCGRGLALRPHGRVYGRARVVRGRQCHELDGALRFHSDLAVTVAVSPAQALEHDRLVHYLARRAVRPGVDFDDLVQAGRLGLLAAAEAWREDGGASFPTFAAAVVRRKIAKTRNREQRRGIPARDGARFGVDSIDDTDEAHISHSTEETLVERDRLARLQAALGTLEPEERRIIVGRLAGKTLESVGEEIGGRDKSTVRFIEQRAIGKLRRVVGAAGIGTGPSPRSLSEKPLIGEQVGSP